MQGAFCLAWSNISRTLAAPIPTNISTKSDPLIEKKGTPDSPATAFARSVFPVPGGPTSKTPFGILPPSFWNFCGYFKNSIISCNSTLASSHPATSAKVVFFASSSAYSLIFAFPNDIKGLPIPPIRLDMKNQAMPMIANGKIHHINIFLRKLFSTSPLNLTFFDSNSLTNSGSCTGTVMKAIGLSFPDDVLS